MRPQVDRAYGEMSTFKNVSIITTLCLGIDGREGELLSWLLNQNEEGRKHHWLGQRLGKIRIRQNVGQILDSFHSLMKINTPASIYLLYCSVRCAKQTDFVSLRHIICATHVIVQQIQIQMQIQIIMHWKESLSLSGTTGICLEPLQASERGLHLILRSPVCEEKVLIFFPL